MTIQRTNISTTEAFDKARAFKPNKMEGFENFVNKAKPYWADATFNYDKGKFLVTSNGKTTKIKDLQVGMGAYRHNIKVLNKTMRELNPHARLKSIVKFLKFIIK